MLLVCFLYKKKVNFFVWFIVACFIRLSKVSLSHFAFMEDSGIKH